MHRFHAPTDSLRSGVLALPEPEAHHALHVLRLSHGERVTVLDGRGLEAICQVEDATRQSVRLHVLDLRTHLKPAHRVTLLQALPKGRMFEDIIQKATELGVNRIVPLLAERVVARIEPAAAAAKVTRWRQTAIEAMKQSGNPWLPEIDSPVTPKDFAVRKEPCDLAVIGSLLDKPRHLREHVRLFRQTHHRMPSSVAVWIGPEGDFTPAEVDAAKSAGALPISLGPIVLRCETAAMYCLSIFQHELSAPEI
jgi:16S rRNA (uracil1498-N3)-methyltransferase